MSVASLMRIPVGIVIERQKAMSQWIDYTWRPVAALPGLPDTAPWTVLADTGDTVTIYVGATEIELFRTETGHYRDNLTSGAPALWVTLRPTGGDPPYQLFSVTADPYEGEGFTQAGDDLVETVPMPSAVREIVESFVAEHHVEQQTFKRKRDRAQPDSLARRPPMAKDRDR